MVQPQKLNVGMSLLLVEGADAKNFCIQACRAYGFEHIHIQDFGGIKDFGKFLNMLKVLPDYDKVPAILVVRDAETNPEGAIQSIKTALAKNDLSVPSEPYVYLFSKPGVEFAVLPGSMGSDGKYRGGTLEHLCMDTVEEDVLWKCVDNFLEAIKREVDLTHLHKSRLHSYLAVKNKFVGMKLGEAAKAGAWNWEHSALGKLKKAMSDIEQAALSAK